MSRAPLVGLLVLTCLAGCAAKQQTAYGPGLLYPADTAYSAADAAKDWEAIQGRPMPASASSAQHDFKPVPGFVTATGDERADQLRALDTPAPGEIGSVSHTGGNVDHSHNIYNQPKTAKEAAGLAATIAAKNDSATAAAVARREHQQAQLTAIAAECRYELDAHPGPAYRAGRGYGLGGAIAGTFIEAAVKGRSRSSISPSASRPARWPLMLS
jgi:hypothetical protein